MIAPSSRIVRNVHISSHPITSERTQTHTPTFHINRKVRTDVNSVHTLWCQDASEQYCMLQWRVPWIVIVTRDFRSSAQYQSEFFGFAMQQIFIYVFDMIWEYILTFFWTALSIFLRFSPPNFGGGWRNGKSMIITHHFRSSTQSQPESFGFSMQQIFIYVFDMILLIKLWAREWCGWPSGDLTMHLGRVGLY